MDLRLLRESLRKKTADLFAERFPAPGVMVHVDDFHERVERLNNLMRRVNRHQSRKGNARGARNQNQRSITEMSELRDALAAGKSILVFDCEWHRDTQVTHEIGYTLYGNGVTQSYNLRLSPRAHGVFDFGRTEFLPRDEAYARFVRVCEQVEFYGGQALKNDFDHLRSHGVELPVRPVFDTLWWGRTLTGKVSKLSTLAEHFGVECPRPHCGGNDARYTLEIMLRMLEVSAVSEAA
jgi:hypothetical protein